MQKLLDQEKHKKKFLVFIIQFKTLGVNAVQKHNIVSSIVLVLSLVILLFLTKHNFYNISMALSPTFELQELINENRHWVQTYGNSVTHLKSNHTDILAVDYISDGKTLNATIWLSSGFQNSSALDSANNKSFKKLSKLWNAY